MIYIDIKYCQQRQALTNDSCDRKSRDVLFNLELNLKDTREKWDV